MSKIALCDARGPLKQLFDCLAGDNGSDWLDELKKMLRKDGIIDLDADPFLPNGWQVEQHIKGGSFKCDPNQVELYLANGQKGGKVIRGHELRKELEGKSVFNANLLDWLLAHPQFIPDSWKGKAVFFWGTVYRNANGDLCVRCLYWSGSGWSWNYNWLDYSFYDNNPALLRK
ncbi:MAG: hypothetical protein PHV78_03215 [Patescibacteria group bacterium]|nr:hypothetical protein [Patescibacteria group bacterium]MDD5121604.1 hypothetical protein [Patescibacteria group bacterium]MDD5222273.1 hypothetical protein [Patescibacteria group bacterium]MDD5396232.1 hypothetical protein [Patescibacteria group bacterium]